MVTLSLATSSGLVLALAANLYGALLGVPDECSSASVEHFAVKVGPPTSTEQPPALDDLASEFPALAGIMSRFTERAELILGATTAVELDEVLEEAISSDDFRELMIQAVAIICSDREAALIAHDFKSSARLLERAPSVLSSETMTGLKRIRERNRTMALEVEDRLEALKSSDFAQEGLAGEEIDLNAFFVDPEVTAESRLAIYQALEGFWCLNALVKAVDDERHLEETVENALIGHALEGQTALIECFQKMALDETDRMSMLEVDETIADRARQAPDGVWPPLLGDG